MENRPDTDRIPAPKGTPSGQAARRVRDDGGSGGERAGAHLGDAGIAAGACVATAPGPDPRREGSPASTVHERPGERETGAG